MNPALTWSNALLLTVPPLMWAGNAVVGRLVGPLVPPMTLNFLRWVLAFLIILPMAGWVLRRGSGLWTHWRRYVLLGLLSVGLYNALQYLALKTSSPLNVTLVGSSTPVFMLATGALFFGQRVTGRQVAGAVLSTIATIAQLGIVTDAVSPATLEALRTPLRDGDGHVLQPPPVIQHAESGQLRLQLEQYPLVGSKARQLPRLQRLAHGRQGRHGHHPSLLETLTQHPLRRTALRHAHAHAGLVHLIKGLHRGRTRHQQSQLQANQWRREIHHTRTRRTGIGEGHIHLPILQRLHNVRHPRILHQPDRHAQPLRQQMAQVMRHASRTPIG